MHIFFLPEQQIMACQFVAHGPATGSSYQVACRPKTSLLHTRLLQGCQLETCQSRCLMDCEDSTGKAGPETTPHQQIGVSLFLIFFLKTRYSIFKVQLAPIRDMMILRPNDSHEIVDLGIHSQRLHASMSTKMAGQE